VSQDDAIHVWNLLDDGEPTSFQPAFGKILSANITPAGDKLVCLSENKLARCDLATGEVEVLAVADESVDRGAMSADGRWHAVAAGSGRVRLLDCGTGEVRKVELAGASDDSERIVFVGGGDEPIAGAYSGETVDIWNLNTGQVRASVQVGRARIAFSADGRYLAWASPDRYLGRVVHVRDVAAGETKQLVGHSDGVYALAFSPNGERLATVGLDRALRLWNVPRTQDVLALPTPWESRRLASLNFSPDGRLLFASNGEALSVLDVSEDWSVTTLAGHSRAVYSIDLVPGGEFLVSAGGTYGEKTGEVILWNLETKQEVRRFQEQGDAIFCAACSPDGKYIASSSRNGVLNVSRLEDASIVFTLTGSYAVRFSPNGRKIAVADNSGAVTIWDLESRQAIRRIDAAGVRGLAFSPDGKLLAAACNRGSERAGVRIWEVATGDRIHDFTSDAKYAWRVAFNNDGTRVAAGVDRTVKVWNLTSGKEEFSLEGHAGTVYSAAFNASGDRLVSGSGTNYNAAPNPGPGSSSFFVHIPGEVKLWDVSTGQEILTLNVPVLEVYDVAFSHDDKFLVAACGSYLSFEQQGDVRIWETATGEEAFLHAVRRSRGASISSSD
jgi:WD40 repeat protein